LKVFDHSDLEDLSIVENQEPRGDFVKLSFDAGAEPAFAGDELVALADGTDQDRLKHAVLPQRVGERRDLSGLKDAAWLERVGVNLIHRDFEQFVRVEGAGLEATFFTAK
jgi:hypothetical protein